MLSKSLSLFAAPFLLLGLTGFTSKPGFIVRFFCESNEQDTERFAAPVELKYPPRSAYIARIPVFSERNIKGIYPFSAPDGSWGCSFQLDPNGRLTLQAASTENRGRSMVAYVGTKRGTHQVIDMIIDKPISDGVVTIQHSLTILEIDALQRHFPVLGRRGKVPIPEVPKKPSGMPAN